jgi:site-specific recombinase XerD
VDDAVVEATLPALPRIVAEMIRFQRQMGCRPGEVCILWPCNVDTTGKVWDYRSESNKTEDHEHKRVIFLGPKAQEILRPYLLREKTSNGFTPADSEQKRNELRRENHKTPRKSSQARRRPKRRPKRSPGHRYTTESYHWAISRAVKIVNRSRPVDGVLPSWSPDQLRHHVAAEIRRQAGLEAVQAVLGHAPMNVSEVFAEQHWNLAAATMQKIG